MDPLNQGLDQFTGGRIEHKDDASIIGVGQASTSKDERLDTEGACFAGGRGELARTCSGTGHGSCR